MEAGGKRLKGWSPEGDEWFGNNAANPFPLVAERSDGAPQSVEPESNEIMSNVTDEVTDADYLDEAVMEDDWDDYNDGPDWVFEP